MYFKPCTFPANNVHIRTANAFVSQEKPTTDGLLRSSNRMFEACARTVRESVHIKVYKALFKQIVIYL